MARGQGAVTTQGPELDGARRPKIAGAPRMDAGRLLAMARKEAIQLRRDSRSLILAFVLPVFLVLFFGYAISWDIDDIRLVVVDQSGSRDSRELVEALEASGYFQVEAYVTGQDEAERLLTSSEVLGALVIPPAYAADLARGRGAEVQLILDGSDANTATIALNYAEAIINRHGLETILGGRSVQPPVEADSRVWYNQTLASRNMIVPALIAVIMSIIAAMLTALTIAREWERGTMEQLASTPVHRLEVVLGKLLPYVLIGLVDVAVAVVLGLTVFSVPFRGSVVLLGVHTVLFLIGALGLGIFISAVAKSQLVAMQVAMVVTYIPALLLSGFLFDIASMPIVLKGVSYLIPATYFVSVTRGVFLKGVGVEMLWVQGVFMAAFATVGLTLATLAFKKELPG